MFTEFFYTFCVTIATRGGGGEYQALNINNSTIQIHSFGFHCLSNIDFDFSACTITLYYEINKKSL